MVLFFLRKVVLQTLIRNHPEGLDVWCLVALFVYFHISCLRTAKAVARLRGCAGSPEPSLVAYVISTITSWFGSFISLRQGDFYPYPEHFHNFKPSMSDLVVQCELSYTFLNCVAISMILLMLCTQMLKYKLSLAEFKRHFCIHLRVTGMFALLIGWHPYSFMYIKRGK